jgi:hypothetical protein
MNLFDVKAGDIVSLPVYDGGIIAWMPSNPGVSYLVDAKVWGETAYDPIKKGPLRLVVWEGEPPAKLQRSYDLEIKEEVRKAFNVPAQYKYGLTLANIEVSAVKEPPQVEEPKKTEEPKRTKLGECQIGDQVRIGLTSGGGIASLPNTTDKNLVGFVVGRGYGVGKSDTYVAWEEPNFDFATISLNEQAILPERYKQYNIDPKFRYGRHFSSDYEADVLKAAEVISEIATSELKQTHPTVIDRAIENAQAKLVEADKPEEVSNLEQMKNLEPIKTKKLRQLKAGDQIKLGLDERGNITTSFRQDKFVNATLISEGLSTSRVAWKPGHEYVNSTFARPITEEEYAQYSIDKEFKFSVDLNSEVEAELTFAKPKPRSLKETKTGDVIKVSLNKNGSLASSFVGSDKKSVETTAFRTKGGQCFLLWKEQPSIYCSNIRRITDLEYGDYDIDRQYVYGFAASENVEFEMVQAAPLPTASTKEEVQVAEPIKELTNALNCACDHCGKILPQTKIYTGDYAGFEMVWCKDCINEEKGQAIPRSWRTLSSEQYERIGYGGETFTPSCFDRMRAIPKKGQSPPAEVQEAPKAISNPAAILFKDANLKVGDTIKIPLSESYFTMGFETGRTPGKSIVATILYIHDGLVYVGWKNKNTKELAPYAPTLISDTSRAAYKIDKKWKFGSTLNPEVQIEVVKRKPAKKTSATTPMGFMLAMAGAGVALTGMSASLPSASTNKEKSSNATA